MKTMKRHPLLLLACLVLTSQSLHAAVEKVEVVVYGGTPGGVMAAVEAARHGHRVALINVSNHVGGGADPSTGTARGTKGHCGSCNGNFKILDVVAQRKNRPSTHCCR